MNIVFLSARYPPDFIGGGELSTAAIAEGLADRGHAVTVLTGAAADQDEEQRGVSIRRRRSLLRLWAKPLLERQTSSGMVSALSALLPSRGDILHAHDFRSALLLSLLDHRSRVVTVRDYASICGTTNNMWWDGSACNGCFWPNVLFRCHRVAEASPARKPFRVWQYKYNLGFRGWAFQRIPHHIYTSAALRDRIATRFRVPASSPVIPNPVTDEWLAPVVDARTTARRVGYAGRVESTKGIRVLLEAWAFVIRDIPEAHLELVGDGDLDRARAQADRLGIVSSVTFKGKRSPEAVRETFDRARVVVQPSLWEEPFGRTVIEAYARGRPVVASATGGLTDLVTPETGVLVPPGDAPALAEALGNLLRDPVGATARGSAGRALVERDYTASRIAERHEAFYGNVLKYRGSKYRG